MGIHGMGMGIADGDQRVSRGPPGRGPEESHLQGGIRRDPADIFKGGDPRLSPEMAGPEPTQSLGMEVVAAGGAD